MVFKDAFWLAGLPLGISDSACRCLQPLFPREFNIICPFPSLKVESLSSAKCALYGLKPHTAYEFQVSCKIHPERGLWSNWRTYQTRTPEAGTSCTNPVSNLCLPGETSADEVKTLPGICRSVCSVSVDPDAEPKGE